MDRAYSAVAVGT